MERRQFLGALAAAAMAGYVGEDLDPGQIDQWGPIEHSVFLVDEIEPDGLATSADLKHGGWFIEDGFEETVLQITYDENDVILDLEGKASETTSGALCNLTPEDAIDLAVAIYQAAWELQHRPSTHGGQ